jgi:hypothetical protein
VAKWDVEFTPEFGEWWGDLQEHERVSVDAAVGLLEEKGPHLGFPWSSRITTSRHGQMRELRVQHRGEPIRVLYAFDPRRTAVLLIGGRKTGDSRWYDRMVPFADRLFDEHLDDLKRGD